MGSSFNQLIALQQQQKQQKERTTLSKQRTFKYTLYANVAHKSNNFNSQPVFSSVVISFERFVVD